MVEPLGDGLYSSDVVAAFDGDLFVVLGAPAGPAGSASVELPDGSRWTVDVADPRLLVSVEVPGHDPASSPALAGLLGGDTALMLVDEALPDVGQLPVEDRYAGVRGRVGRWRTRDSLGIMSQQAGRLVVLADLASDPGAHPLVRIVATAELADRQHAAKWLSLLDPTVLRLAAGAVDLAEDVDEIDLAGLDPRVAARVASVCRSAALRLGDAASGMRRIGDRVHRYAGDDRAAAGAAPVDEAHEMYAADAVMPVRVDAAPPPQPRERSTTRRIADGLLRVQLAEPIDRAWVRVLRRDGLSLVGLAPLDRRTAEVPVPPDISDGELVVDVVTEEQMERFTRRSVDSLRAAIRVGRDAARAMRLGEVAVAAGRWERCSALWSQVGDGQRAEDALILAASGRRMQRSGPLVCDAVVESVDPR